LFKANVDSGFKLIEVKKDSEKSHVAIVATHNTDTQEILITKINLRNDKNYKYDSHVLKEGDKLMD
jgi:hypothetical protein